MRALTTTEQSDVHCEGMSDGSKPVVCLARRPAIAELRPTTAEAAAASSDLDISKRVPELW